MIDRVSIEGDAGEVGREIAARVIRPVAEEVAKTGNCVHCFYLNLIVSLLLDVKTTISGAIADQILAEATAALPRVTDNAGPVRH